MVDRSEWDLFSLDRDVARGWRALGQWRAALGEDLEEWAGEEPLEPVRHVAGKSTWDALAEFTATPVDAPLREGLKRWVFALMQARIGLPDEVALARASSDPCAIFAGDPTRQVSWIEAWRGVVAARSAAESALWLAAAADAGPALAGVRRRRAARRLEMARRLGVKHPWAPVAPIGPPALLEVATRFLDRTEDLSRAVWKDRWQAAGGAAAVLHAAVGREAGDGWPAHLTARWLEEAFGDAFRGLRIELPPLPTVLGATSFVRAMYSLGVAVRIAATPASAPFALAHEPAFVQAHRLGFALGALAGDARWQVHALGVGRRVADAQSRVLARSAFLDARLHATRLLLGDDAALAPPDRFEELGVRVFGRRLDPRLCGAWPAPRDDEPGRFLALVESPAFAESLRDRFDSDWYRNPRAWTHLHGMSTIPAQESIDIATLAGHAEALARAFEGALG